jgi:hypothetical protein
MNQCIRLMNILVKFSFYRPVAEVKLATVGIISILGNIRSVFFENYFKKFYSFKIR